MATIKFPGDANPALTLNRFTTHLGTGAIGQRVAMLDEIDDEFGEERMLAFSLAGNLDAPELIPNGTTVKRPHFPAFNVHTEPGTVAR